MRAFKLLVLELLDFNRLSCKKSTIKLEKF